MEALIIAGKIVIDFVATALIAVGVPEAAAFAVATTAVQLAATTALTSAVTALTTPGINSAGSPLEFRADPDAPIPYIMGETATGSLIIHENTTNDGENKWLHVFGVLSLGPIESIDSFSANDIPVTFTNGIVNSGNFYHQGGDPFMWMVQRLGTSPSDYLPAPSNTGSIPEWTADHKATGYAMYRWILDFDPDVYPTGLPKPRWVVKGVKVYDPRLDSTYPGGSGSHRINDETTWAYSDTPALHALAWCVGRHQNGIRMLGLGAPAANIDIGSFVEAANVQEDNGWTVGGLVTSRDSKWEVLKAICQAGGSVPIRSGAQISCLVQTPRVSIATFTGDDVVGDATIPGTAARRDRKNRVLYRYRSAAHGYEMTTAAAVEISAYVTEDGQKRTQGVDFPLVSDVDQGAQLAHYGIYDSREIPGITLRMKPHWASIEPGDVITADEPEYGLNDQDLLVVARTRDPQSLCPVLVCRTETEAKHAAALAATGEAPETPSLTGIDLTIAAPGATAWAATGATFTAGGVSIPGIVVTGASDNINASDVIFEFKPADSDVWAAAGADPAQTVTRKEIGPLTPGTLYDVAISYRVRGAVGARLIIEDVESGDFAGSGATEDYTPDAIAWANISSSGSSPSVATTTHETVTGISASIEIELTFTGAGTAEYSTNNGSSWTSISSGGTVSIGNGTPLGWRFTRTGSAGTSSGTATVKNLTDTGDPTLDTFTYSCVVVGGVTPNPVNWTNLSDTGFGTDVTGNSQTISGISSSITILMGFTGDLSDVTLFYRINGGSWLSWIDGTSFSISNGQNLAFHAIGGTTNGTATVSNFSDGGVALDTFTISLIDFT